MWGPDLQIEILGLFAEAQRAPERLRIRAEARAWVYVHRVNARRREAYAERRALQTEAYRRELERCRENQRRRWRDQGERLLAEQAARNAAARAERVRGHVCADEKCDRLVAERSSRRGPTPRFCSHQCSRRTAARNYWRRKSQNRHRTR